VRTAQSKGVEISNVTQAGFAFNQGTLIPIFRRMGMDDDVSFFCELSYARKKFAGAAEREAGREAKMYSSLSLPLP
jgi:hypothetical protein